MERQALAEKILVLGVDGMDPRLTRHYLAEGKMPNLQKLIARGACREDLTMLGALPTITPPMWTTLATGSYPVTHGITCFWNQSHDSLDTLTYALDSRVCQSEQLWNVFAEAGKKTLVWHWPGSSWPPTSDSPDLHVVDGTQPGAINMGGASIDWEKITIASEDFKALTYKARAVNNTGAGCVLTDVDAADEFDDKFINGACNDGKIRESKNIMFTHEDGELSVDTAAFDIINSPITEAKGWAQAPEKAKEFIMLTSGGFVRRPVLILPDEAGNYDRIAIYKSKQETEPLVVLHEGELLANVVDDVLVGEEHQKGSRHLRLLNLAQDGSYVRLWISSAFDITFDAVWHPKALYQEVVSNVGYVPQISLTGGKDPFIVENLLLPCWDIYCKWQADALNYLIKAHQYDVIFSHIHNVDSCGHCYWYYTKEREGQPDHSAENLALMAYVYQQTDRYFGEFLPLLEEGWTIIITSDHGLLVTPEDDWAYIGDAFGVNINVMEELGYTAVLRNEQGERIKEIDWAHTKAIAPRGNHIWLNLKGRDKTGIVEKADQYELESEIIDALYQYRFNGKRVISLALRNKDALLLGLSGPETGDIVYFLDEAFTRVHGDSLSTALGDNETSVSPLFIAAGRGIKPGFRTKRIIRQVDVAPTIAVLGGVRMPADCEGAPIYQILAD